MPIDPTQPWTVWSTIPDMASVHQLFRTATGAVLACGQSSISPMNGGRIWRSTDDGLAWTLVCAQDRYDWGAAFTSIIQLSTGDLFALLGLNPARAGADPAEIWRSVDDGLTWTFVQACVDSSTGYAYGGGFGTTFIGLARLTDTDLIASLQYDSGAGTFPPAGTPQNVIWRSTNLGLTWTLAATLRTYGGGHTSLRPEALSPTVAIVGEQSGPLPLLLWRSAGGGGGPYTSPLTAAVGIQPRHTSVGDFVSGRISGVTSIFKSVDVGATWVNKGTVTVGVDDFADCGGGVLIAALRHNSFNIQYSLDAGETWAVAYADAGSPGFPHSFAVLPTRVLVAPESDSHPAGARIRTSTPFVPEPEPEPPVPEVRPLPAMTAPSRMSLRIVGTWKA